MEYADGQLGQWTARIVATDAAHDLAVLRIDAPPERLRPVKVRLLLRWHSEMPHLRPSLALRLASCKLIWCIGWLL